MKQIVVVVKPYLAEQVLDSLRRAPLHALSVQEVKGFGRQKSYLGQYGDSDYTEAFLPKVQITLWVDEERSEELIQNLCRVARSGRMGDGKIFVLPVASGHE
jgi:nitrogen regulatory protein P-II 1